MNVIKSIKSFTGKHGSTMCVIGVVVGLGVTIYETWKARPKVDRIMDEYEAAVNDINADEDKTEEEKKKAVNGEKVEMYKKVAVTVAPVVVSGVATAGLSIAGHVMDARKIANMAATIEMSDLAYRKLESKLTETLGEEKAEEIKKEIHEESARRAFEEVCPDNELSIIEQGLGGSQPYYDPWFDKLFRSDDNTIREVCHELNERMGCDPLKREPYITYEEFYDKMRLSIPRCAYHYRFNANYLLKPYLTNTIKIGDIACTILEWRDEPCCVVK